VPNLKTVTPHTTPNTNARNENETSMRGIAKGTVMGSMTMSHSVVLVHDLLPPRSVESESKPGESGSDVDP